MSEDTKCQYCGEIHHSDRTLSYDGFGLNLCDQHKTRIATFQEKNCNVARSLGNIWQHTPELMQTIRILTDELQTRLKLFNITNDFKLFLAHQNLKRILQQIDEANETSKLQ
jgi:hypothetical protein